MVSWGIPAFDKEVLGLPKGEFSIIETPGYRTGLVVLSRFIYDGLTRGDLCVFVSFDSAETFVANFSNWGMDFQKYLDNDQFIFLNYQANISNEIGLTHQYTNVFDEITRLTGGRIPQRIAIQQADTLMNLNNLVLMNQSAQKLRLAINEYSHQNTTVLGQFVQFGDETHAKLSIALQKTVRAHFVLVRPDQADQHTFVFHAKKLPWFLHDHIAGTVTLRDRVGFK